MGVNGVGNGNIDWGVLLNNVAVTSGVNETQGPDGPAKPENLVLTDADKQVLLGLLNAPEIDAPAGQVENPAEKLESLLEKLQDGTTFDFTEEQTQVFVSTLTTLLQTVNALMPNGTTPETGGTDSTDKTDKAVGASGASNVDGSSKSSKVFFDLYALLALLLECAQEQKNASREIRSAELSAEVTSIQNQADEQKSAALTGLIAGSIICALQVGAAIYSVGKTVSNMRQEAKMTQEFGVKDTASQLNEAKTEYKQNVQKLEAFNKEHSKPLADKEQQQQIENQRAELQKKVEQSKANVAEKNQLLTVAQASMTQSEKFIKLQESNARLKGFSEISQALGNLGQTLVRGFVDLQQADAMRMGAEQKEAENGLEETKELMTSFQDLIDQMRQLMQAVLQAENESMSNAIQA